MEYIVSPTDIRNYLILPNSFDWQLIDQELGFGKIFKIVPISVYEEISKDTSTSTKEIFRLLTKAATHYAFILSIPKLKVHISNFGIQEFNQDKIKAAAWWDIRDLGLSLLRVADKCFSDALTLIYKDTTLKEKIPLFKEQNIISTPEELENIYSINYSPEVFILLIKFFKQALMLDVSDKLKSDCITAVLEKQEINSYFKSAIVFYALYYASLLPSFVFLQNSIAIQYEELPWQKSKVLSIEEKLQTGENFKKLAEGNMKIIIDHIKANLEDFPCYKYPLPSMVAKARDSGVSLLG